MMTSMKPEDRIDGAPNFYTSKDRFINILEEHDIDGYVTIVIEDPSSNVGKTNFKKNQDKVKRIIF